MDPTTHLTTELHLVPLGIGVVDITVHKNVLSASLSKQIKSK